MVELKARFDEQNNLEWVRRLEEEGIHVAYGSLGLKTHTKTALVVRQEGDGVTTYSHIGTGNYNSETAAGYVDLGVLTADRDTGQDLVKLFNFFTGPTLDEEFRKLLVAPVTMRERFTEYIRREAAAAEAGEDARIIAKVNGLEDPEIVAELYAASMAGVEIDLIVRDICRLRPGLAGVSETVTVHSIVGRFLEHSRIFYFYNGGDPEWYIGSADWMTRNLDNRVEAVTPVTDPAIQSQLRFTLETILSDNRRRWVLNADGTYDQERPGDDPLRDSQVILMERTRSDATAMGGTHAQRYVIESGTSDVGHIVDRMAAGPAADDHWADRPMISGVRLCSRGKRSRTAEYVPLSRFAADCGIDISEFEGDAPEAICSYCWATLTNNSDGDDGE